MKETINHQKIEVLRKETIINNFNRLIDGVCQYKTWYLKTNDGRKICVFDLIDAEKLKNKFEEKLRMAAADISIHDILTATVGEIFDGNMGHALIYEQLLFTLKTLSGSEFYLLSEDEYYARKTAFSGQFDDEDINDFLGTKPK